MAVNRYGYISGVRQLIETWTTDDFYWMLCDVALVPNPFTQVYVADLAGELTDATYNRVLMTTPSITVDAIQELITYECDDPDFGVIDGFEIAKWLVLYHDVTNDSDSEVVCVYPAYYVADNVDQALFILANGTAYTLALDCPADW